MNTFKFLNSCTLNADTFAADMSNIRRSLYSFGVCWTDTLQGNFAADKSFRVVLYVNPDPRKRAAVNFKNPLVKECNGLILEYNKRWSLLAMPPQAFCTNTVSMDKADYFYQCGYYDVYEVLDATILTLYYYNGEWRLSSTKGYDIGNMNMTKDMTFMEALHDLMNTKYDKFKLENLNIYHSYTIALRHSKYHIFNETKHLANRTKNVMRPGIDMNSYIMLMTVADLSTASFINTRVPGIPVQTPLVVRTIPDIRRLYTYAHGAYDKYNKAFSKNEFIYKPLYGYILRRNNRNVPHEYSTIFIESELFIALKHALYMDNSLLLAQDYKALAVKMTTNIKRHKQFRVMFEQFEPQFSMLDSKLDVLSKKVMDGISTGEPSGDPMVDDLVSQYKDNHDITEGIIKDAMFKKCNSHYLPMLLK